MKIAGHTMGTPELDIYEAIALFHEIGFEGIEIRCQPDGQIDLTEGQTRYNRANEALCARIRKAAEDARLEIVCLSAYSGNFSKEALAEEHKKAIRHAVDVAVWLGCPGVRVMGGAYTSFWDGAKSRKECERTTARHLKEVADYAAGKKVSLLVETHASTMAETGATAKALLDAVGSPGIGVIYDQDQIDRCEGEEPDVAAKLLAPYIRHVHLCPYKFEQRDRAGRTAETLAALRKCGYIGYLSVEYPRHGNDKLPPGREMMARDLATLKKALKQGD
jgi:L-ribulose-5-phosphate 3-epimerase